MSGPSAPVTAPLSDFFVSYTSADQDWAQQIAWWLEEARFSVFIQAWDFRPGHNFVLMMDRATRARQMVAVLSPSYLEAAYCQQECAAILADDPKGEKRRLIPVRVKDCRPDGLLRSIIFIDLVGLREMEARERFISGLRARAKPLFPPRFPVSAAIGRLTSPRS
jgi:hypothetical protein